MIQSIHSPSLTIRLVLAALLLLALLAGLPVPPAQADSLIIVTGSHDSVPADDGFCSLREAITNANSDDQSGSTDCAAGSGADTIVFSGDSTITLLSALPPLTGVLTISGSGYSVTVSGGDAVQVFMVMPGADVTLSQLTISDGAGATGGGIFSGGALAINHSTFSGNHASDIGGAIFNYGGALTVSYTTFSDNSAGAYGGGAIANSGGTLDVSNSIFNGNSTDSGGGGLAILSGSTAIISHSTLSSNSAAGGGGIAMNIESTLTVSGCTFDGNSATTDGGGIINSGGTLTIDNSAFISNTAVTSGGGIVIGGTPFGDEVTITGSLFRGNQADLGGGIISLYGTLTVGASSFDGNSAVTDGGGIYIGLGTLAINNSTFSNNSAGANGGAITNNHGTLAIDKSTFSSNSAGYGGGIDNSVGTLMVYNSTFSENTAVTDGGGVNTLGGFATISSSTLSGNQAGSGGGIRNHLGALYLYNSLVANSPSGGDCNNTGAIAANTNNLVEDGSCSDGATGFVTGDPKLGSLGNYGGATPTFALQFDSSAIDAGDPATCAADPILGKDQRGQARDDLQCDIGAFELKFVDSDTVKKSVPAAGAYTFGPTMVKIVVNNTGGCLTGITIQRVNDNHPNAASLNLQTGHWWEITPTGCTSGFNVNLTLPTDFMPDSNDKVCRWNPGGPGAQWDCVLSNWTSSSITRNDVTAFSQWTAGDNSGPTVVRLNRLTARGSDASTGMLVYGGLLALASVCPIILLGRRARSARPNSSDHGQNA